MISSLRSIAACVLLALASACTTTDAAFVKIPLQARFPIPGETVGVLGIKSMSDASTQRAAAAIENTIKQSLIESGKKVLSLDSAVKDASLTELEKGVVAPELLEQVRLEIGGQEQVQFFIVGSITSFTYSEDLQPVGEVTTIQKDIWGNDQAVTIQAYTGSASCSLEGAIQVINVEDGSYLHTYMLDVPPFSARVNNEARPAWNENEIKQTLIDKANKEVVNLYGAANQERTIPFWVASSASMPFQEGVEDNPKGMALSASAVPEFEQARRAINTDDMDGAREILESFLQTKGGGAGDALLSRLHYNLGVVAHYSGRFGEARDHYRKAYRLGNLADAQRELNRLDDDEARLAAPSE